MATREYRSLDQAEALALLRVPAPTLICCHARPDADCLGSAFALSLWLSSMGSPARVVCADEIPERLRFLVGDLQESILPASIPAEFADARVISADTSAPSQMDKLFPIFGDRVSLMIDHHAKGEPYADHLIMQTAACAEIVQDLIALSGVEVPQKTAELLYAGIVSDTGCFRHSNVTRETHLHAAALVETGLDVAEMTRKLFETKSFAQMRAEHAGFERLSLYREGRVALVTFPLALREEMGLADEHLGTLIDVARTVSGVLVAASLRETEKGVYRGSLRANADLDVAAVAATFGGGGHKRAAGLTIHAEGMEEAANKLLAAIGDMGGALK